MTSEIEEMMPEHLDFLRPLVHAVIKSFWKRSWRKPSARKGSEPRGDQVIQAATIRAA